MHRRTMLKLGVALTLSSSGVLLANKKSKAVARWDIRPNLGVEPILFGKSRAWVRRRLPGRPDKVDAWAPVGDDVFSELGVRVIYEPTRLRCQGLELRTPAKVFLEGKSLLDRAAGDVVGDLRKLDPSITPSINGITSMSLGLHLTAPRLQQEPGKPAESVLVFTEDYFAVAIE